MASASEPDEGEARKRQAMSQAARPSPSHFVGPSLSPLKGGEGNRRALRLGLRRVKGLSEKEGRRLAERRGAGYGSPDELCQPQLLPGVAQMDGERPANPSGQVPCWVATTICVSVRSASACPAYDCPRITVNVPTMPDTTATTPPISNATWTGALAKKPG